MKTTNIKKWTAVLACAVCLPLASQVSAISFDAHSAVATHIAGNTTSAFYEVSGAGVESGTAAGLFSATLGGDADTGFWVKIAFGSNPQPGLTSAFLKASNEYLWWDSTDLAAFNSGTFDSITLWNNGANGIKNTNNKFQGTSHAGLNGTPGTTVPDGGSTLLLLGAGLAVLGVARRRA